MTNPLESRAATPGLGKCTDELKTTVPEEVKEEFTALSVLSGQKPADYLRDLVIDHLYGHLHATRLRAARKKGTAEFGRNWGEPS